MRIDARAIRPFDGQTMKSTVRRMILTMILTAALSGCQGTARRIIPTTGPSAAGLTNPQLVDTVEALCVPPVGWNREPLKHSSRHNHQVWLSPSRHTAYGIIHFSLPLPVSAGFVLPFFLQEMKKSEGEAILLNRENDPGLPGVRFVAEGGRYKMRGNLIVHGWNGWAVYAGTLRKEEIDPDELDLAERARDHTVVGVTDDKLASGTHSDGE